MNKYMKNIFAFPGVGVKFCGKELSFFKENQKHFVPYIENASKIIDKDLTNILTSDFKKKLSSDEEQFFAIAYSCGVSSYFASCGIEADGAACYSFGIYPALYSTGVLTFNETLNVMKIAEEEMAKSVESEKTECGMAVVVGLIKEDAEELIKRVNRESIIKVNENNDTCIIVSGLKDDLKLYIDASLEEDAVSAELLDVNIPYHHPQLLKNSTKNFRKRISDFNWQDSKYPIISSIDRTILSKGKEIQEFVIDNINTPINWANVIERAAQCGAEKVFECGHGISLTQNGRFSGLDLDYINIKNYKRKLNA